MSSHKCMVIIDSHWGRNIEEVFGYFCVYIIYKAYKIIKKGGAKWRN